MEEPSSIEATNPLLGKLKISSGDMHTILAFLSFAATCAIGWALWTHSWDTKDAVSRVAAELKESNKEIAGSLKDANKELGTSLREMTQATREQTCMLSLPENRRAQNADLCKRLTR